MSSWYLLTSMGFYSLTPASNEYIIGVPHFKRVLLNSNGKKTIIEAVNLNETNIYIQKVYVNNMIYTKK